MEGNNLNQDDEFCILCCNSFKCWSNPAFDTDLCNFQEFCKETVMSNSNGAEANNREINYTNDSLCKLLLKVGPSSLSTASGNIPACPECLMIISDIVSKKKIFTDLEFQARSLQMQVLKKLEELHGQLQKYRQEMEQMQDIVKDSDVSILESYMETNSMLGSLEKAAIVMFRNKILTVSRELLNFQEVIKARFTNPQRPLSPQKGDYSLRNIPNTSKPNRKTQARCSEFSQVRNKNLKSKQRAKRSKVVMAETSKIKDATTQKEIVSTVVSTYTDGDNSGVNSESEEMIVKQSLSDFEESIDDDDAPLGFDFDVPGDDDNDYIPEPEDERDPLISSSSSSGSGEEGSGSDEEDYEYDESRSSKTNKYDLKNMEGGTEPQKTKRKLMKTKMYKSEKVAHLPQFTASVISKVIQLQELQETNETNEIPNETSDIDDPMKNYAFTYDFSTGSLSLSNIIVLLNENEKSLICSVCRHSIKTGTEDAPKLTTNGKKARILKTNGMLNAMLHHILGNHLDAFRCATCNSVFKTRSRYREHLKGHLNHFNCDTCGKSFSSRGALRTHKWRHMTEEEIQTALANGETDPREKLKKWKEKQSSKPILCSQCGRGFGTMIQLTIHQETHLDRSQREQVICPRCGKSLLKSGWISHQASSCQPEGAEMYYCNECPPGEPKKGFSSKYLLKRHLKRLHSSVVEQRPQLCSICGKGFKLLADLKRHIVVHSDARPFECANGCGANFKTRKHCKRHEGNCKGNGWRGPRTSRTNSTLTSDSMHSSHLTNDHQKHEPSEMKVNVNSSRSLNLNSGSSSLNSSLYY